MLTVALNEFRNSATRDCSCLIINDVVRPCCKVNETEWAGFWSRGGTRDWLIPLRISSLVEH